MGGFEPRPCAARAWPGHAAHERKSEKLTVFLSDRVRRHGEGGLPLSWRPFRLSSPQCVAGIHLAVLARGWKRWIPAPRFRGDKLRGNDDCLRRHQTSYIFKLALIGHRPPSGFPTMSFGGHGPPCNDFRNSEWPLFLKRSSPLKG